MTPFVLKYVTKREQRLLQRAQALVERVPADYLWNEKYGYSELRCHELARAVNIALEDQRTVVQDGWFQIVEHSWIWTHPVPNPPRISKFPKVLDVYQPVSLPQVTLLDFGGGYGLPWHRIYVWDATSTRDDIRVDVVKELLGFMRS